MEPTGGENFHGTLSAMIKGSTRGEPPNILPQLREIGGSRGFSLKKREKKKSNELPPGENLEEKSEIWASGGKKKRGGEIN